MFDRAWQAVGSSDIRLRRWREERGATAVEMALVMPFALLLLLGVIHFGSLLYLQNSMTSIANDVVRRVAVGDLTDGEGEQEALSRLTSWSASFTVTVDEPASDEVRITIAVPVADAAIVDLGDFAGNDDLVAEASMRRE